MRAWLIASKKAAPFAVLFMFALIGYGFYISGMSLLDDDLAGRFKGISNQTAISTQIQNFERWVQGRPIAHALNVTFQTMFQDLPEYVIQYVAFTALTLQAFVIHIIGRRVGLPMNVSLLAASVFLITPAAASLNLVIHALATEISTWFIFASIWLALDRRCYLAGFVCALQVNAYETYLTVFFIPMLFVGMRDLIKSNFQLKRFALDMLKFAAVFFVTFAAFFYLRGVWGSGGREAAMGGMSIMDILGRMVSAGSIGSMTNLDLHLDSFLWAMRHGPNYIFGLFLILVPLVFFALRWMMMKSSSEKWHGEKSNPLLYIVIIVAGVAVFYFSYFIFFVERYPPTQQVSRLANIHSGSRFGIYFITVGLTLLGVWAVAHLRGHSWDGTAAKLRLAGLWGSAVIISAFIGFNHAYGYQQMLSGQKKYRLADALQFACERTSSENVIVLILDEVFDRRITDPILSWGVTYLGVTSFEHWDTRFLLVPARNREQLLSAIETEDDFGSQSMVPLVYFMYNRYSWLFPYGDVQRWSINRNSLFVVDVRFENGYYSNEVLVRPEQLTSGRRCVMRPR